MITMFIPNKGKGAHLYSATRNTVLPVSYQLNASHYLPSRATAPSLGVKIPGSCQHTHAGLGLTCLPSNAMALPVLIYSWMGWSFVNLNQGSAQPKLPQFWLWSVLNQQPLIHEPRTIPLHHQGSTNHMYHSFSLYFSSLEPLVHIFSSSLRCGKLVFDRDFLYLRCRHTDYGGENGQKC